MPSQRRSPHDNSSRTFRRWDNVPPFWLAAAGSLLLFAAQPPLGWSWLAWLAPLPWLAIATSGQLPGRRPYLGIWLAGSLYWVMAIHWIRLAHPATAIGLVFLAGYLGVYLPLFVGLVRSGMRATRMPLCLLAPVVWVAMEGLQAHLLGGFLMAALPHTQIEWLSLIQISDLGGSYLVSLLMLLVSSATWQAWLAWWNAPEVARRMLAIGWPLALASGALASALWYGDRRLEELTPPAEAPTVRIALIQGNEKAVWTSDPGRDQRVLDSYVRLTRQAVAQAQAPDKPQDLDKPLDLVVWPESAFRLPLLSFDVPEPLPTAAGLNTEELAARTREILQQFTQEVGAPLLVGLDRQHGELLATGKTTSSGKPEFRYAFYNAAAATDREGNLLGHYDKMHLVMFGEYVPGGSWFPWIYNFFPIGGLTPGSAPQAFEIEGVHYSPTICYETVLPQVTRKQVAQLDAQGKRPDVLVNVTNDSWFDDSSELDMHLTCSRLRAVECRTPLVVAANGGLSANIDRCGRVLALGRREAEDGLLVDVVPQAASSRYVHYGDWLMGTCLLATAVLAIMALYGRWRPSPST